MDRKHVTPDDLWKGAIEDFVKDFIYFFFEGYIHQIDWNYPIEFLDKELNQLYLDSLGHNRRGDKLLKLRLKNETYCYFLIHVEVQGYNDLTFPQRMFQCYYRLKEKHNLPVAALVLYTNDSPKHHYRSFEESFMKTELIYRFPTFVLRDMPLHQLEQQLNPFGLLLEVAWHKLQKRKWGDEDLLQLKLRLAKKLYQRGYTKLQIGKLLDFIKHYMPFERKENFLKFEETISKSFEPMGIRETIIEHYRQVGLEEGREQGLEKGIEQTLERSIARMQSKGLNVPQIADLLGVTEDRVNSILEKMDQEK